MFGAVGACELYFSRVNRVVHDLNPSLKGGHLEQTQVRLAHVVEIHWRILPRVVLGHARIRVGDDLVAQRGLVDVHALRGQMKVLECVSIEGSLIVIHVYLKVLSGKQLHAHDGKDEPEDETHEQHVEDGWYGLD